MCVFCSVATQSPNHADAAKPPFRSPVDGSRDRDDLDALAWSQPVRRARQQGGLRLRGELVAHAAAPRRRIVRVVGEGGRLGRMTGAVRVVDGRAAEQVGLASRMAGLLCRPAGLPPRKCCGEGSPWLAPRGRRVDGSAARRWRPLSGGQSCGLALKLAAFCEVETGDFAGDGGILPLVAENRRVDAGSAVHLKAGLRPEIAALAALQAVEIRSAGIAESRGHLRDEKRAVVCQFGGNVDDVKLDLHAAIARAVAGTANAAERRRLLSLNVSNVPQSTEMTWRQHSAIHFLDPLGLQAANNPSIVPKQTPTLRHISSDHAF